MTQYYIAIDGKALGPYTLEALSEQNILPETLIFSTQPDASWKQASLYPELASLFEQSPEAASVPEQTSYDNNQVAPDVGYSVTQNTSPVIVRRNIGGIITLSVLLFLSILACLVLIYKYVEAKNESDYYDRMISSLESDLDEYRAEVSSLRDENATYKQYSLPIYVTGLKMGNLYQGGSIHTEYGKAIYSSSSMFIGPQIEYYGLSNIGESIRLYYKIIKDGNLWRGSSSPNDYTSSFTINISRGNNTVNGSSWGSSNMGFWPSGKYRYELWYNDMCLKAINFNIY